MNDKWEDTPTPTQIESEYRGIVDLFPALHKYRTEHTADNLKKLCVEVSEFCTSIYASTRSDSERRIFFAMLDKLKKLR